MARQKIGGFMDSGMTQTERDKLTAEALKKLFPKYVPKPNYLDTYQSRLMKEHETVEQLLERVNDKKEE